jgi:DNA-binding winged helix-turn-helix (wHTH) protein
MARTATDTVRRFGVFELDLAVGQLRREGRSVRIQPQPLRLLCLLTSRPGALVTREEIQASLWPGGTFVDFEQGVNFAIKQMPKRGYRFVAPVTLGAETAEPEAPPPTDAWNPELQKAMWANIAELRLADHRRRRQQIVLAVSVASAAILAALWIVIAT